MLTLFSIVHVLVFSPCRVLTTLRRRVSDSDLSACEIIMSVLFCKRIRCSCRKLFVLSRLTSWWLLCSAWDHSFCCVGSGKNTDGRWATPLQVHVVPDKGFHGAQETASGGHSARACTNELVNFWIIKIARIKYNVDHREESTVFVAGTVLSTWEKIITRIRKHSCWFLVAVYCKGIYVRV